MINRVLILSCLTALFFTIQTTYAKDASLEELKQMIDASAHLSEPASIKSSNVSNTSKQTEVPEQGTIPSQIAIDELEAIPNSRRVLLDVRSNHSDGAHDMDMLAGLAKKRGIDTLVFGEHDRYTNVSLLCFLRFRPLMPKMPVLKS